MKKILNEEDVKLIRELSEIRRVEVALLDKQIKDLKERRFKVNKAFSQRSLAEKFEVSKSCIQMVLNYTNWSNVA